MERSPASPQRHVHKPRPLPEPGHLLITIPELIDVDFQKREQSVDCSIATMGIPF